MAQDILMFNNTKEGKSKCKFTQFVLIYHTNNSKHTMTSFESLFHKLSDTKRQKFSVEQKARYAPYISTVDYTIDSVMDNLLCSAMTNVFMACNLINTFSSVIQNQYTDLINFAISSRRD